MYLLGDVMSRGGSELCFLLGLHEKGVKLKEAEICSNVPWLFQVETLLIGGKRGIFDVGERKRRVVSY
jgi:hypothetical protein